jgi:hypothetical protein
MYESKDDDDNDSEFYLYSEKWESTAEGESDSVSPEIARFCSSPRFSLKCTNIKIFNSQLIDEYINAQTCGYSCVLHIFQRKSGRTIGQRF